MANYIKQFFNELGDAVFPKTREKAVYDDNDVRLDNKLALMKNPVTSTDHGTQISDLNNFLELNKLVGALSPTTLNMPIGYGDYAKVINIGYQVNVFNQYAIMKSGFTFVRKFVDWETPKWGAWQKCITTADIVQSDTIGGVDKLPNADVTKTLGLEIDALTNNLIKYKVMQVVTTIEANTPTNIYKISDDTSLNGKTIVCAVTLSFHGWFSGKFVGAVNYDQTTGYVIASATIAQQYTIVACILYL